MRNNLKNKIARLCTMGIMLTAIPAMLFAETIGIFSDNSVPQIKFAAGDIKSALESKGFTVEMFPLSSLNAKYSNKKVVIALSGNAEVTKLLISEGGIIPAGLGEQAYGIRTTTSSQKSYWVLGGDINGAMYGALQIAENIKFNGYNETYNGQESPVILKRGIKLNLPFDEKSPTYETNSKGTSYQNAIPNVWDISFWQTWFDEMARHRYNVISVWNNHPFTSLVQLQEYPDLAIQNVTGFNGYSKKMSIDEKIAFWKEVMNLAHSRGFEFLFFNWNVWVANADGKYGLANGVTTEANKAYMYKSMLKLLETYPELDGFGVTNGENDSNEDFLWEAYGKAMYDFAVKNPQRKLRFIHRWHQTTLTDIKATFSGLFNLPNVKFEMSYKYSKAHMYSTPVPKHFEKSNNPKQLVQNDMKTWFTIRNDDFYYHTWGDPSFARTYLKGMLDYENHFAGFYIGSDGFCPTRTFFCKNSISQGILEIQRQWYMNMIWGRLAYNPNTSDDVFRNYMKLRYPSVSSGELFTAWSKASSGIQRTTELMHEDFDLDFKWYPEACNNYKGFATVDLFASADIGPGSLYCNIKNSAAGTCGGKKDSYQLANEIEADAFSALNIISAMSAEPNTQLWVDINNIRSLSYLSLYYAYKIRGATYKLAGQTSNTTTSLGKAYCWWINYTNLMDLMYEGQANQRVNPVLPDWHFQDATVLKEYTDNGGIGVPACNDLLFFGSTTNNIAAQRTDLVNKWDTIRPLVNPDKGWYHHMLDNGIHKYLIQNEKELTDFPGMDHLYLRLAWAFLEPEEGKFDWSYIDNLVEKYVPMGYKISFRISCKETGKVNEAVPVELDGIRYATPFWVVKAGAKGIERPEFGSSSWTPDWDDPVYLEKLDNFHKAFAEKYDGKPWVRYIDVGSIGDWGEGHTWSSTRIPPTFNEVKTHINLYLKHYKNTQLIVTDDLLASTKSDTEKKELLNYALENGFSLRDDSPMVQGYMQNDLKTWTVRHPEFFAEIYKTRPTVFELEHYGKVKSNGYWIDKNGAGIIPDLKVKSADVFRNAVKIIRPTYVGFHGYLGEWLTDNPEFTKEMLNMCGYWYFPKSISIIQNKGRTLSFEIEWLNKGVAPAYSSYQLRGKLIPKDSNSESIEFIIEDSGNRKWMPGVVSAEKYTVTLSGKPKGEYSLAIQLFDTKWKIPVEIGLATDLKAEDYFKIHNLSYSAIK